ncbi:hypothetical protein [Saccharothrix sp. NRRL B-16348]|nr:hypothetical protein [Saccharothrix sp. NRRL B-16348]
MGEAHEINERDGGCDVARCLVTDYQRLMCNVDHDCGETAGRLVTRPHVL